MMLLGDSFFRDAVQTAIHLAMNVGEKKRRTAAMKRVSRFWAGAGIWDGRCTCTEAGGASPPLSWLEKLATLLGPSTGTVTQCVDKPQPCGARYWWLQGACLGTRRRITGHGARSWTPPEPPQCIPADLSD